MIESASWLLRGLFTMMTLLAAGSCFLACLSAKTDGNSTKVLRRNCALSAGTAGVLGCFWLLILTAETGGEWQAVYDPFYLELVWTSPAGDLLLWRGLALLALITWATASGFPNRIAIGCALLTIFSFTQYGHALGDPQGIKATLLVIHLSVVAWWFSVVPALLVLLVKSPTSALALAQCFGRQAKGAVAISLLSGFSFLGIQLAAHQWDLQTPYAKTMLIKLLIVSAIMTIAAINHFRLTPALKARSLDANTRLRSILCLDAALFVSTIFLSSWLTGPGSNN